MFPSRSVLSPEARLLLASADTDSARDLSLFLEPGLDWERLSRLTHRERAAGPMWEFLKPVRDRLPGEFSKNLERTAAFERLRQQQLLVKLESSVGALDAAGIPPLLLKGAALVLAHYGEVTERPMADIDLLVSPGEAKRARELLLDCGWKTPQETYPEERYDRHHHHPPLMDEQRTGIELEVHTGLLIPGHPFAFGPEDLRRQAREVEIGEATALVPNPRSHLLYLCLHFAWGHSLVSAGWRTFRDVGVLTAADAFRWEDFLRSSRDARAEPASFWTLRLARDLAGIDVPGRALDDLSPALPDVLVDRLASHYALDLFSDSRGCPSVKMRQLMWIAGNEWGYRGNVPVPGERAIRPWQHSGDFGPMHEGEENADSDAAKLKRHLREGGRWSSYLRRVLFTSS